MTTETIRDTTRIAGWLPKVLLLAAAYFITGKLGLLLAVPPGYATAVWPPSGIALVGLLLLGSRHWPGVLLGSFCVNAGLGFDASNTAAIIASLATAGSIAFGAAMQALAGAWLIKRFVGWPSPLIEERHIFRFMLLSGPVSCIVNASWSVGTLWWAGAIPGADVPINWCTWWSGDVMGVWIFAMLGFVVFSQPPQLWRGRKLTVGVPLAVMFAIAVVVFFYSRTQETRALENEFQRYAQTQAEFLRTSVAKHDGVVRSLASLFDASENVDRRHDVQLQISDSAAPVEKQLLYNRVGTSPSMRTGNLKWSTQIEVGERAWKLEWAPTLEYLAAHQSWTSWLVLAAGLLFTSLFGAGLLLITGRTAVVEAVVRERTAELHCTNEELTKEIGERKESETRREELLLEVEAKNAELERFSYAVSHDLKSPLITIKSFVGMVERNIAAGKTERVKDHLQRVGKAADTMNNLLEELLKLSRVGRVTNPPELVPFDTLAREAVDIVTGRLLEKGAQVYIDSALAAVSVTVDRRRMIEVFQNLLDNAVKFMGQQTEPKILVGVETSGETAQFYVRDNGIGIEARHQGKIFGLFDKLDPRSEGTGIGLALVKRIIETHGGRIWVESQGQGRGSTFWFTLAASNSTALSPIEV